MKPFMITEENITDELISQLEADEMQRIQCETDGLDKETSIEYRMAKYAALNVDFIETAEELRLYTDAIYNAVVWGKTIR